ncbi:MAG: hypothetical protein RL497_2302 [Pseudomonadota bacterium]|jgi:4-methyl-5(b-hydroxyethyl)-thiazole monophosphate biosynthesis
MKRVLIPLANGCEEIEAITLVDVLRRAQCHVTLASIETHIQVTAAHGVGLQADCFISDCRDETFDLIALPGGMPGSSRLAECTALIELLNRQRQRLGGIAAICAAPAVVLGQQGWLKGKNATGYPAFAQQLTEQGAKLIDQPVVRDGNLITSQGPATAMLFALELVRYLMGDATAEEIAAGVLLNKM